MMKHFEGSRKRRKRKRRRISAVVALKKQGNWCKMWRRNMEMVPLEADIYERQDAVRDTWYVSFDDCDDGVMMEDGKMTTKRRMIMTMTMMITRMITTMIRMRMRTTTMTATD